MEKYESAIFEGLNAEQKKAVGSVEIPQEAFMAVLSVDDD